MTETKASAGKQGAPPSADATVLHRFRSHYPNPRDSDDRMLECASPGPDGKT